MKRIEYLDAIRGLAAFSVVIYHFIGWRWADQLGIKITSVFINGADAVSFFFVLSGFVLSFKFFQTKSEPHIPRFVYKRILRLYPAFLVTVLMNYFYWNRHGFDLSLLADMFYKNDQNLWQELVMVRNNHKFYIPGWTMGVEMVFSLFMPFLVILAQKNIKYIKYLMPISIFIGQQYMSMYLFHFLLGILLAYYYPQIKAYKFKESRWFKFRYIIPVIVLFLFSARHFNKIKSFGSIYNDVVNFLALDFFHFSAIASFVILLYVINNEKAQGYLENKFFLFLGKISYSIYLTHWLVVVIVMEKWDMWNFITDDGRIKFAVMLGVTIVVTLVLATLMYYTVEKVFMQLSYRTAKKFFPDRQKQ